MSSNTFSILYLDESARPEDVETAYRKRRAQFVALTARGPLRHYREKLLAGAENAYNELKQHRDEQQIRERPQSLLSRKVANFRQELRSPLPKSPWKSERIVPESLPAKIARQRRGIEKNVLEGTADRAEVEDRFCLLVLYRLEGDLIRYTARQELLGLARKMEIHPFRANLLMAQIVESVRQHKLHETPQAAFQANVSGKSFWKWLLAGAAVLTACIIDVLIIGWMR